MLDMNRQHGTLPVKERIVRALRRARDPVEAVANAVSDTILGSVKAEDPLASAFVSVTDIIRTPQSTVSKLSGKPSSCGLPFVRHRLGKVRLALFAP